MMLVGVLVAAALQVATPQSHKPAPSGKTVAKSAAKPASAPVARKAPVPATARVVIDAGHGGRDPGATLATGSQNEKDIALQVALKVGDALRAAGVGVVFTRTTDTLIARADRGRIANQAKADLFISIHVNAANPRWRDPGAARGFETYFLGVAKTEDAQRVEEMEEQSAVFEARESSSANDPLGFILSDMMQNEHLRESSDLAGTVHRHLAGIHPGPDRGVKQAGFTVLVSAFMPAILVEIGFGTNADEAAFISNPSKQRAMAKAIAAGTREFLERHQRRVGGGAAGVGATGSHD